MVADSLTLEWSCSSLATPVREDYGCSEMGVYGGRIRCSRGFVSCTEGIAADWKHRQFLCIHSMKIIGWGEGKRKGTKDDSQTLWNIYDVMMAFIPRGMNHIFYVGKCAVHGILNEFLQ